MVRAAALSPALIALMTRQGGVFTMAQARAHGHPDDYIGRLRKARVLVSLRRGIYAWHDELASADAVAAQRLRAAALEHSLTARAVFSHETAAALHGLALLDPDMALLHVTRELSAGARTEAGVRHHVAELPPEDVASGPRGIELTTPARTTVDLARATERLECAVAAFDSALRSGVSREALRSVARRCSSWPGARCVATALDLAEGRAANPGESWSRVVLIEQGVPPSALQVPAYDEQGLIGYADFGWDGEVLGEFDGRGKYGIGVQHDPEEAGRILWREKRREDRMRVRHEVVRWTFADLHAPEALGARVRAALVRAAERRGRAG